MCYYQFMKYTYKQVTVDDFDSRWDTPYGMITFKRDTSTWPMMAVCSGGEYQTKLIEALVGIQEMIVMQTGKSPIITIS